ncbi:MAG: AI-2E family transporter [Methylocella sp.]
MISIALAFAVGLLIVWQVPNAILIVLAGMLAAVIFDAGARGIGFLVSWPRHLRLAIVFILTALAIPAALSWGGTTIAGQAGDFIAKMKELAPKLNDWFSNGSLGLLPGGSVKLSQLLPSGSTLFGGATKAATAIFEALVTAVAIIFIGAFFAWEPSAYKAGVLSILPQDVRARVNEVLDQSAYAVRGWMLGQSVSMMAIFLFSLPALFAIGMPDPALLALQAGLLTFVPTVGPFVAGVVIILAGLSQSPTMALYGLGVYIMIQFLESQLITPVVQNRAAHIPPAIGLGIQLIAGALFGVMGVVLSLPLAAAAKVIIEELYVKDRLGGPWQAD